MKMKKAMAGVFAGIVAVSAMATSAISVNAAETTQTERKATVDFDSASTSWVFSAKGRMIKDAELAANAESMASAQATQDASAIKALLLGTVSVAGEYVTASGGNADIANATGVALSEMDKDAMVTMKFPMQIEDLKITFTGTKAGTTNKTVTATVSPRQKNAGNWAYYTMGIGNPVDGGKSSSTLNLSDFNLAKAVDFKVSGKVYNKAEYRSAQDANELYADSIELYRPDADGKDGKEAGVETYNKLWNIDGKDGKTSEDGGVKLYSSSLNLTAVIGPDGEKIIDADSTNIGVALMQSVFGTGDLSLGGTGANGLASSTGDNITCIQSEYMDITTNNYRTLFKDSKPYQNIVKGYWEGTGRYDKAKGLAFEDLKENLTRYVVDIVGNSKGSTLTFNMVRAANQPFTYSSSSSLDDFGWQFNGGKAADKFAIGINSQRTSAIQMSASADGNTDTSIEISWDKLVERSGLAVNALGLIDDIFIASDDPTYHIGSLDVYRPANTFEDLSAGEPTVDSEDTLSSVDTTVATSEAPVVTAPAVDTTAAPATTAPVVATNPGTGNAPIALAVIPVAIAAAAIIAKKRK